MQLFASVAVIVKEKFPGDEGVPVKEPPDDKLNPVGNEPEVTAKVYGAVPPLAVIVWLYATPLVPLGSVVGESVIVGHEFVIVRIPPALVAD